MTGHELIVYLAEHPIARLLLQEDTLVWQYHPSWQQQGFAVSPHLPLADPIAAVNVHRFLRNLLPEGNPLEELLAGFHLSKHNTFGLIRALGADTPGALVLLPPAQPWPQAAMERPLSERKLSQRLDNRKHYGLVIWDGKPRLSVAGVQDKINVVVNPQGELSFGEGALCSTHLLKFEQQKYTHLVLNEYVTMRLANTCGLPVAEVALRRFGHHPALLVTRFDRQWLAPGKVLRRHVIDGCQALNLPPEHKYERNFGNARDVAHIRDGASLPRLFAFAGACSNPAQSRQLLLDWVLFNLLLFNQDAHGKNVSFYVGRQGISLAPFYDLVNIAMYPEFEQEMAMALGDEFDANTVHAYQLADFAASCHLPRALVATRLKRLATQVLGKVRQGHQALAGTAEERDYLRRFDALIAGRCEHLLQDAGHIKGIVL